MSRLRYAGYDPSELNWKVPRRAIRAHQLFQSGHDTMSISKLLGITEAEALKRVSIGRSHMLARRSPYEARS